MVSKAVKDRVQKLEKSQDLIVEMKPEFEAALKKCISFSSKLMTCHKPTIAEKGRSAFLLKGGAKYKRKRDEIEDVKAEESMLKQDK
jgi:hypothetical protein